MAQSKRQQKINSMIVEPRMDRVALARIARKDIEPVYDIKGNVTETQRRSNVFRILRQCETITPNQSAAGARLVELYAAWRGLAGAPDGIDVGFVDNNRSDPELVTDRMMNAGREWKQIMGYVGPSSARLLLALCQDIVEGDGKFLVLEKIPDEKTEEVKLKRRAEPYEWGNRDGTIDFMVERAAEPKRTSPKVRWRHIVETVTGETDRNHQSRHVQRACVDLEQYWK